MEVAREKVSGPEAGEVKEDSGEKSTRRKKRVKGRKRTRKKAPEEAVRRKERKQGRNGERVQEGALGPPLAAPGIL